MILSINFNVIRQGLDNKLDSFIFGIKRYFKTAEHPYFKNYLKYKINPVLNKFWQESIS